MSGESVPDVLLQMNGSYRSDIDDPDDPPSPGVDRRLWYNTAKKFHEAKGMGADLMLDTTGGDISVGLKLLQEASEIIDLRSPFVDVRI